ncbi:MAG: hypothetical protein P8X57_03940 [Cyclobacteriaceae bacterium]
MNKRHILFVVVGIFLTISAGIFRPVPKVPENDLLITRGTVANITEAGVRDIVFELEGTDRSYYINRGIDHGIDIRSLKEELIGKDVVIKYPDYWTILDPRKKTRHITKLESGGEVIFTEI